MSKKDLSKKIIKLDPLAERLDNVGMTGGAGKKPKSKKLSKEAKEYIKDATKQNLKYSKEVSKIGKRGDFGSPMASKAAAKELKTMAKEKTMSSGLTDLKLFRKLGIKPYNEARKYLKNEKVKARKQKELLRIKGLFEGGEVRGTGAAIRGKGFKGVF